MATHLSRGWWIAWIVGCGRAAAQAPEPPAKPTTLVIPATLEEALASRRDLWGEAALLQPGGPSYEFFAELLPPLRYVHAAFREAPLVLADPYGGPKVRVAADGSGLLLRAEQPYWSDAVAPPILCFVAEGADAPTAAADWRPFGRGGALRGEPELRAGWIPIVTFREEHAELEVLVAPTPKELAPCVRLRVTARGAARCFAIEFGAAAACRAIGDARWQPAGPERLQATLHEGESAALIVAAGNELPKTTDLRAAFVAAGGDPDALLTDADARVERDWREALGSSFLLDTPEPRVDAAWRATLAGTLMLFEGDTLLYSAQNGYHCTFEAECGDALRALWRYGVPATERGLDPLLARPLQRGIEASDVGWKAILLREWWELERARLADREAEGSARLVERADLLGRTQPRVERVLAEVDAWLAQLDGATGLLPKQAYCGDIATPVDNLHTNASFWRGVRDLGLICADAGGALARDHAERLAIAAAQLRTRIVAAVAKSTRHDVEPPFVPMALFGGEEPYDHLTATMTGSYWNLVAPYAAGSGVFRLDEKPLEWLMRYPEQHGGLCMGMVRFDQHSGLFANAEGVDDLYTLHRAELLLQLDRPDDAVVAFYGKLAHGMTRGTWLSGEGSSLRPLDERGRPLYLPPNSAGSAFFLSLLRGMVVHEVDHDGDGRSEELRLAHATPRRWFAEPGAVLELRGAPTSFGAVAFRLERSADGHRLHGRVALPTRAPLRLHLRVRLPESLRLGDAVETRGTVLPRSDDETIDLTGRTGRVEFDAMLMKAPARQLLPGRPGAEADGKRGR